MDDSPNDEGRQRVAWLFCSLVGQVVHATLRDGATLEGLLSAKKPGSLDFVLSDARLRAGGAVDKNEKSCPREDVLISASDVVYIAAVDCSLTFSAVHNIHDFKTDGDIARGALGTERALEKWTCDENFDPALFSFNTSDFKAGQIDQFAANAKLGVVSTYHEDFYTTKLDRSKLTHQQMRQAETLANEIEGKKTAATDLEVGGESDDEEALFSAVQRPGSYVPPGMRGKENGKAGQRSKTEAVQAGSKPLAAASSLAPAAAAPSVNQIPNDAYDNAPAPDAAAASALPATARPAVPQFPAALPSALLRRGIGLEGGRLSVEMSKGRLPQKISPAIHLLGKNARNLNPGVSKADEIAALKASAKSLSAKFEKKEEKKAEALKKDDPPPLPQPKGATAGAPKDADKEHIEYIETSERLTKSFQNKKGDKATTWAAKPDEKAKPQAQNPQATEKPAKEKTKQESINWKPQLHVKFRDSKREPKASREICFFFAESIYDRLKKPKHSSNPKVVPGDSHEFSSEWPGSGRKWDAAADNFDAQGEEAKGSTPTSARGKQQQPVPQQQQQQQQQPPQQQQQQQQQQGRKGQQQQQQQQGQRGQSQQGQQQQQQQTSQLQPRRSFTGQPVPQQQAYAQAAPVQMAQHPQQLGVQPMPAGMPQQQYAQQYPGQQVQQGVPQQQQQYQQGIVPQPYYPQQQLAHQQQQQPMAGHVTQDAQGQYRTAQQPYGMPQEHAAVATGGEQPDAGDSARGGRKPEETQAQSQAQAPYDPAHPQQPQSHPQLPQYTQAQHQPQLQPVQQGAPGVPVMQHGTPGMPMQLQHGTPGLPVQQGMVQGQVPQAVQTFQPQMQQGTPQATYQQQYQQYPPAAQQGAYPVQQHAHMQVQQPQAQQPKDMKDVQQPQPQAQPMMQQPYQQGVPQQMAHNPSSPGYQMQPQQQAPGMHPQTNQYGQPYVVQQQYPRQQAYPGQQQQQSQQHAQPLPGQTNQYGQPVHPQPVQVVQHGVHQMQHTMPVQMQSPSLPQAQQVGQPGQRPYQGREGDDHGASPDQMQAGQVGGSVPSSNAGSVHNTPRMPMQVNNNAGVPGMPPSPGVAYQMQGQMPGVNPVMQVAQPGQVPGQVQPGMPPSPAMPMYGQQYPQMQAQTQGMYAQPHGTQPAAAPYAQQQMAQPTGARGGGRQGKRRSNPKNQQQ